MNLNDFVVHNYKEREKLIARKVIIMVIAMYCKSINNRNLRFLIEI